MTLTVTKVTVLRRRQGTDIVALEVALPAATYPYHGCLDMSFPVSKGEGVHYAMEHFPDVPRKIVCEPGVTP